MEEGLLSLLCRRYFPDKVINDFDFLNLFPINLVYFAYQNLADKAVQYGFVQLLNRCVLADFPDKASYIVFLLVRAVQEKGQILDAALVFLLFLLHRCRQL